MASEIDICNLALSRLGDRASVASIDPPEGSAQADHCARFYPLARDIALEARPWTFNTTRITNDPIYTMPQPGWQYAYAKPNNCLRVIAVIPKGSDMWSLSNPIPFDIQIDELTGAEVILTDLPDAAIIYQIRIIDTNLFPPQFVSALSWLLASYLAGPVVKGDAGRKAGIAAYQAWEAELARAATINSNQGQLKTRYVPRQLQARGYGYDAPWPDAPVSGPFGFYAYPDGL